MRSNDQIGSQLYYSFLARSPALQGFERHGPFYPLSQADSRQRSTDEALDRAVSVLGPDLCDLSRLLVDPGSLERGQGGKSGLDGLEDLLLGVENLERGGVCRRKEVRRVSETPTEGKG